ncbi:Alpha/Beta hydrolase protein [Lyophyllum atratum]|nr:Alpha/Beta hydrolase protein [Lyophyllum atratum]
MASGYKTVKLPDGAMLAYELYGSFHLGVKTPIVLICGMSALRHDYERLSRGLAQTRPVLIYDHRGMGNSTLAGNEDITIEMLARDLLFLLTTLRWKDISICGYSMGGVVAQQLLVLPYHPTHSTPLPFRTTHLFLVGTRSVVQDTSVGIGYKAAPPGKPRSLAERKAVARKVIEMAFDPKWIAENGPRLNFVCDRVFNGIAHRPGEMIAAKQGIALQKFQFADLLSKLPADMKVMVIHGTMDQVIPIRCGEDIAKRIHGVTFVQKGTQPGQVPSLDFGHFWYEYFDIKVWNAVVNVFINDAPPPMTHRLYGFYASIRSNYL